MMEGFDASEYQGPINFSIVGKGFAYFKASEGETYLDRQLLMHADEANRTKLPWGAYHFLHPREDCKAQGAVLVKLYRYGQDLLPAVDIEETAGNPARDEWRGLTSTQVVQAILDFAGVVKSELGCLPLLYIRPGWIRSYVLASDLPALAAFALWVPYYSQDITVLQKVNPLLPNKMAIWQYTNTGRVNGIAGNVDLDRCLVDLAEITLK